MRASRWLMAALVISLAGAGNSWADRGSYRGGHWGGHFGTWAGVGLTALVLGAALYPQPVYGTVPYYTPYYGPYPAPYYAPYYPPVTYTEPAPTVYVNPPPPPQVAQAPASDDWYYCKASNGYYPYIRECPSGWQRVPPRQPGY